MYKQYASALFDAIKNRNLPTPVKILLGLGVGYILSPIDILPDLGVPLGLADDTVLAAILIAVGGKIILDKRKNAADAPFNKKASANEDNVIDL